MIHRCNVDNNNNPVTSESEHDFFFEEVTEALREEDFSALKSHLDHLHGEGVVDLSDYFASHPAAIAECMHKVKILRVNKATLALYGAKRQK